MLAALTAPETRPVWSQEAEQAVLGALMLDPQAIDRVASLKPAAFFDGRHRAIFMAICSQRGSAIDEMTVCATLQERGAADECGGLPYLAALTGSVPSAANIERYAEIVAEHAAHRALLAALDEAMQTARGQGSTSSHLDAIQARLGALARSRSRQEPRTAATLLFGRLQRYEDLEAGRVSPGMPTHIPALDRLLGGGLRDGWLYVVAARPSVGKSSFSQQILLTLAADGHPGLMCSLEMAETQCIDRAVSHLGRVDGTRLATGKFVAGPDGDWGRIVDATEALARMPVYFDDQAAVTINEIRAKARMVKGLRCLVVDYLQLCGSELPGDNRNLQIEEISRGLKSLAKELRCPVLALSQLNRKVEERASRRPTLADLRDSGAIEQDADAVIFLWPAREIKDQGVRIVGCEVAKNREGQTGEFALAFTGSIQRWGESTAPLHPPVEARKSRRSEFE